ncbi:hypothetical protein Ngar_c20000 [Candidatus Nitrososphaera gargensis Ga9.2]|uniref:Uncharacterized protein n=1 Tax=Nitrososphaera gargensis (strain Ga9.2) TaxID=1237085 RepID=K0IKH3_NITGG|nr:hypothetical protein [Candidatus Nitrososphaera gargensis]AFU58932.1 hypothetical protein Ngar_c20000 [Candidatus Nitrososphaera gargensis Ga9.2]
MVYIIKDWDVFKQAALLNSSCCNHNDLGCYRIIDRGREQEVKVLVGKFGYTGRFVSDDPEFEEIISFCQKQSFAEITGGHIEAGSFFSGR